MGPLVLGLERVLPSSGFWGLVRNSSMGLVVYGAGMWALNPKQIRKLIGSVRIGEWNRKSPL